MLKEFFDYKNQLMKTLCSDARIVKLLTDSSEAAVPNYDIPYHLIFPYEFIPETVSEGKTFICYDVDIIDVQNKTYCKPALYIWVFTHKSKLALPEGGVRTDELANAIDAVINGSRDFCLGELELDSVTRFVPIIDYQGRCLTYVGSDFNRLHSEGKPAPSRRPPL